MQLRSLAPLMDSTRRDGRPDAWVDVLFGSSDRPGASMSGCSEEGGNRPYFVPPVGVGCDFSAKAARARPASAPE